MKEVRSCCAGQTVDRGEADSPGNNESDLRTGASTLQYSDEDRSPTISSKLCTDLTEEEGLSSLCPAPVEVSHSSVGTDRPGD